MKNLFFSTLNFYYALSDSHDWTHCRRVMSRKLSKRQIPEIDIIGIEIVEIKLSCIGTSPTHVCHIMSNAYSNFMYSDCLTSLK
jgi:hypothetical protein